MPRPFLVSLLILLSAVVRAADAPPDLPDPYGLGPRLVLLDHLRTQFGLKPPEEATYDQLVTLYRSVQHPAQPDAVKLDDATMVDDEAMVRDRVSRLRAALKKEFNVDAAAAASETDLVADLRRRRDQRQQQAVDEGEQRNAHERAAPAGKAITEGSVDPTPAAEPIDTVAAWRGKVIETRKALEAIPTDFPIDWSPIEAPLANVTNPCRIRRNGGPFEYRDAPPAQEPGLEVWLQNTGIEEAHVGGYQTSRWWPATWIAEDRQWTIEHPARHRWARESQHYANLMRLLVSGPSSDRERVSAWIARRKALSAAGGDPLGDTEFLAICAAAAKDGGFADALARVEAASFRIEGERTQLDADLKTYQYADDLAHSNSGASPDLAKWQAVLENRSRTLMQLHHDRRQLLILVTAAIVK